MSTTKLISAIAKPKNCTFNPKLVASLKEQVKTRFIKKFGEDVYVKVVKDAALRPKPNISRIKMEMLLKLKKFGIKGFSDILK